MTIQRVLDRSRLGVLATQHRGQPHASLVAFTAIEGLRYIIFATYRNTRKYQSMAEDGRVAVLIDDGAGDTDSKGGRVVLTAIGEAIEIPDEERLAHTESHLARRPDLWEFLFRTDRQDLSHRSVLQLQKASSGATPISPAISL